MPVATESSRNIQMHASEGFCREINKLDVPARLHAIGLIVESLKNHEELLIPENDIPHLIDLRGIGTGTWGDKEQIDEFIRTERESWNL
jgi:hypothetical protein